MRVIIAGGRDITAPGHVLCAIEESGFHITEVVCGEARGVDAMGRRWAEWHGVPVASFPADWDQHGKAAGFMRNESMAEYSDALIAVWDGKSRGTADMIQRAVAWDMYIHIYRVPQ